jgi:hypothetical protein
LRNGIAELAGTKGIEAIGMYYFRRINADA